MKALIAIALLASSVLAFTPLDGCRVTDFGTPVSVAFEPGLFDSPGDKLAAIGAGLLGTATITSIAVLPWLTEAQRKHWYAPITVAALAGAGLWLASCAVK